MPSVRVGRRTVVIGGVVVIVVAGGTAAWAMSSGSGASYRMATAEEGSVEQTLSATGTLSPVHDDSGSFQLSGTVEKVKVKVGQRVSAGQVLAVLDESSLKETLRQAKAALATDETRLSDAENGQLDATGGSNSNGANANANDAATFQSASRTIATPTARPAGAPGGGSGSSGSTESSSPKIAADQAAIRRAQQAVDAALGVARTALDTEKSSCASASTPPPTTSPAPTPTATSSSGSGPSCSDAASSLLTDQTVVNTDEANLDQAELALTKDLQAAARSATSNSSSQSSKSSSQGTSKGSSGGTGSSSTVTAADLASDQAAIDSAKAQVATAKDNLDQATLRTGISGTVTAVTIAKGDSVSSSTTSPAVEVVGAGQEQVAIALSASQIRQVKVGMTASVVPDGMSTGSTGKVVAIQAGGTESSTGTVSYPVTITIPQRAGLVNGAAAGVTIVAAQVDNVLTVPTSAVHRSGLTAYVETLVAGKPKRRTVTIGAVGASSTQINSGLAVGTRVVLADMNASLPSSSANLTTTRGGGGAFRRFTVNGNAGGAGGPGGFSGSLPGGGSFSINRSGS